MVVHTASRRVMDKAGLTGARTFHQDWPYPIPGDEHGDVEYALSRDEWERQQGAGYRSAGEALPPQTTTASRSPGSGR